VATLLPGPLTFTARQTPRGEPTRRIMAMKRQMCDGVSSLCAGARQRLGRAKAPAVASPLRRRGRLPPAIRRLRRHLLTAARRRYGHARTFLGAYGRDNAENMDSRLAISASMRSCDTLSR
jgi:hypothetical protein